MTMRCLLILLLVILSLSCESKKPSEPVAIPSPSPSVEPDDPKVRAANQEGKTQEIETYQGSPYRNTSRIAAREAASQFVKAAMPKWTLKGMSAEPYEAGVYWIDVDLEKESRRAIISLLVKQFYPENGDAYWRAFLIDKSHASQLRDAHDSEIQRQLTEANDELRRCQNP